MSSLPAAANDLPEIGQVIINMRWGVFDLAAARRTLLVGDRPYFRLYGLSDRGCMVSLPLSPTKLFVAVHDVGLLHRLSNQQARDTVRNANVLSVQMAVKHVYGSKREHLALVEKRLRRKSDPIVPGVIMRPSLSCGATNA